jgi:DNA-binding transcriptional MerR regulator/methylmalonyl-CoA mutase cobalamin-binding subunit
MNIGAVERDTGLGKDTLRVWERRYGFPQPERDSNGERVYPANQVERLRLIKRLMDQGHRPGRLIAMSEADLSLLANVTTTPTTGKQIWAQEDNEELKERIKTVIHHIKTHDTLGLRQTLSQAMARQGLHAFVLDTMGPLNEAIGEGWMRGELAVFEEHLYSEQIKLLLRQAISSLPDSNGARPRILLTTVPDELHVLGLLMADCLFTLEGAACISLGTQTPLTDIRQAAAAHHIDIVALSFSSAFSNRLITPILKQLRQLLPQEIALWAGGAGVERLPALEGVDILPTLSDALETLHAWRSTQSPPVG